MRNETTEKFILWGCGANSTRVLNRYCIPIKEIEIVVDIDKEKIGSDFFSHKIKEPQEIKSCGIQSRVIVIGTTDYYDDVIRILHTMDWDGEIAKLDDYATRYPASDAVTSNYNYEKHEKRLAYELIERIQNIGAIRQDQMENARLLANRNEGIKRLPKGGVIAEVGVAYGDFSDVLLEELQPEHFYAIDYFNKDNPYIQMWGRQELVESGLTHEEWYRNKYKDLIESGRMTVCQGMSWECLSKFDDDFFDMVYLDACHDYDSIRKDTEFAIRKTKHGGIIQFNDYTIWDVIGKGYYGVIPVVNQMIKDTGSQVLYYCLNTLGYSDVTVQLNKR